MTLHTQTTVSTQLPMALASMLFQVLRDSFPRADANTKQCVVEYISDNQLVNSSNVTSLLQTYSVTRHQNIARLCVEYIMGSITARIHHVQWEVLEGDTVRDVVLLFNAG